MLQFSKQMQQHADYGTRVMETETIQKDGASLKSRMSRGNFLRTMLMAAMLMTFCLGVTPAFADDSGSYGTGVTYTYTSADHKLTISGMGAGAITSTPWSVYKGDIQTLVINSGVTSIPSGAFSEYGNLKTVRLEDGNLPLKFFGKGE